MRASQFMGIAFPVGFFLVALLAFVCMRSRRTKTLMQSELLAEAQSRRNQLSHGGRHASEAVEMDTAEQPADIRRDAIRAMARKEAL